MPYRARIRWVIAQRSRGVDAVRIGLDARLNAYRRGGIPTYTQQLLTSLAALAPEVTFVALQHLRQSAPLVMAPNVQQVRLVTPPHNRREQWTLPLELSRLQLDLLHCPDFVAPRRRHCPAVITIHDLAFYHFPAILDQAARRYYQQVSTAVWDAEAVIADSYATRDDIVHFLRVPPERVDVIHIAAASGFRPLALAPGSRRRINGCELYAGRFMLFVSTLEPRKNLPLLLQALRIVVDRHPQTAYQLVIVGSRGWHDHPIFAAVRDLRLYDHVLFLGSVAQEELCWLYNACRLYVNPSRYEGFGLPALEALACAAPTIAAAASSLPEVVGDAGLLLPPDEPDAWATSIAALWDDTQQRAELTRRGPAQAARFSWEQTARATLAVYRRVLG